MSSARKHTADALDVPKLLPVSVAILDRSGTIVGVNEAWKDFGRRSNALVEDKFAARFELGEREYHDAETAFGRSARGEAMHAAYSEETSRAIQRYEMNLQTLSRAELEAAFREMQSEIARRSPDVERLFFNEPFAAAKFDHWAQRPTWSMEDGAALLLGKDPDIVNLLALKDLRQSSAFAGKFVKLLYRLQESKERGELSEEVPPLALIEWVKAHQIEVPSELTASIEAHIAGVPKQQPQETQVEPDERAVTPNERTAWAKERDSLEKMLITMAMDGYGYQPGAAKSPIHKQISDAAKLLGMNVDPDTSRKHLKNAAEHIDPHVARDLMAGSKG